MSEQNSSISGKSDIHDIYQGSSKEKHVEGSGLLTSVHSNEQTPAVNSNNKVEEEESKTTINIICAINQAKRMTESGSFDLNGQERFLNFIKKENFNDLDLNEETWHDWVEILEDLTKSTTEKISSAAT